MSGIPPPPAPTHLLRAHLAPVNALWFSEDNERLYSGDSKGHIVVTSTRSLRPLAQWQAHNDGILGIEEWNGQVITHGRDNKLHVWSLAKDAATTVGESAATPGLSSPALRYSMDVNALNYCRFSLMPSGDDRDSAFVALPNLLESSMADIWELPSQKRIHAAVGKREQPTSSDGRGPNPIGIIMSMQLLYGPPPDDSSKKQLRLLCAYENGSVTLRQYTRGNQPSIEGIGWESVWTAKLHVESVMAMAVSNSGAFALTVSADHLIGRYDLLAEGSEDISRTCSATRMKNPGNGSLAIRDDGRVCAVGGWDGKVRLYSTKSLKPLGTLDYHKSSCQAVAFARYTGESPSGRATEGGSDDLEDSEDEMSPDEKVDRRRWLAVGSQDNRVSIWCLISFGRG